MEAKRAQAQSETQGHRGQVVIELFMPPKPPALAPTTVHRIQDEPDEPIVETAYERRLRQMREWHIRKREARS